MIGSPSAMFDVESMAESFDPGDYRELIQNHVASERIRWWKAVPDPAFNPRTGSLDTASGYEKWIREEQTSLRNEYRALVQGITGARRYLDVAQFEVSDVSIVTMPDELPLGEGDWVVPVGIEDTLSGRLPDARALVHKHVLGRGQHLTALDGQVSSSGTTITGTSTTFLTDLSVGDLILCANQYRRVTAIASNTSLTVNSAPSPAWGGHDFKRAYERLPYHPVPRIEEIRTASTSYVRGTDFQVGADEASVQWLGATQPDPGTRYSIVYRYLPKYVILGAQVSVPRVVCTVAMPQMVIGRLVLPEFRN